MNTGVAVLAVSGASPKRSLLARILARLVTPPPPPRRHFSKSWGYK
jgi:hypothetical protein